MRPSCNNSCRESQRFTMTKEKDLSKTSEDHNRKKESILSLLQRIYPQYSEKCFNPSSLLKCIVLKVIH